MSAKKKGGKSRSDKGNQRTVNSQKENTRKHRPTILVGEPFPDITQPTRREIWLDRLKRFAKWLGGLTVSAIVAKLLKRYLGID